MFSRYLLNLSLALAAGFLVVATQAFVITTVVTLVFAVAIGMTVIALGAVIKAGTSPVARASAALAVITGAWTIVASLIFANGVVSTLGFAGALGILALAIIGLTAHERSADRVVHSLHVTDREPMPVA